MLHALRGHTDPAKIKCSLHHKNLEGVTSEKHPKMLIFHASNIKKLKLKYYIQVLILSIKKVS